MDDLKPDRTPYTGRRAFPHWLAVLGLIAAVGGGEAGAAESEKQGVEQTGKEKPKPEPAKEPAAEAPVYRPPLLGAPGDRLGASTRGTGQARAKGIVTLLVPQGGGLSADASPSLSWHLATPFRGEMRLALSDAESGASYFALQEAVNWPAGLQHFDLEDWGLALPEGRILRWRLSLMPDGGSPLTVESLVEHRRPTTAPTRGVIDWAAKGYWFDALAASHSNLSQQKALLESVGLGSRLR